MTTVAYPLGRPLPATQRGGDCRARDLDQGRNVHGPHRFASTTHCRISNGLLRVTVGTPNVAPALTISAWRGRVTVGDVYDDVYDDIYGEGGSVGTPAWLSLGTLIVDSPSVSALLTAVRLVAVNPEVVIIRLVAPAIADTFVTLRRGMPGVYIQHGDTRAAPLVSTTRRIRWTGSPALAGVATTTHRIEEPAPPVDGLPRFVAAFDPVTTNAGAFSLTTTASTVARFGAGAGSQVTGSWPDELNQQLGDASRPQIVVT